MPRQGRDKSRPRRSGSPDGREQARSTEDVHHSGQVVGEHVQSHLGGHVGQTLHQEVRRPHPRLDGAEGMLDGLAPHPHQIRARFEPRLDGLDQVLVFPARDPALLRRRALPFDRAGRAGLDPADRIEIVRPDGRSLDAVGNLPTAEALLR